MVSSKIATRETILVGDYNSHTISRIPFTCYKIPSNVKNVNISRETK